MFKQLITPQVILLLLILTPAINLFGGNTLTDIGKAGVTFSVNAQSINESGQVTGRYTDLGGSGDHAFIWTKNYGFESLKDTNGSIPQGQARSINDLGQITGQASFAGDYSAYIWEPNEYSDIDLGTSDSSVGFSINNSGSVTGYFYLSGKKRAFVYDSVNGMQDIGDLGGTGGNEAWCINNAGQVTGYASFSDGGSTGQRAFIWDSTNGMQQLPMGPNTSIGRSINDLGQIAGQKGSRAFLWDEINGVMDLGDLPGGSDMSFATSVNNYGVVVGGSSSSAGNHAFMWDRNYGMIDLNELLSDNDKGWTLISAESINDSGQIAGTATDPGGNIRGYILEIGCLFNIAGDVNDDCVVNLLDIAIIARNWLTDCMLTGQSQDCVLKK